MLLIPVGIRKVALRHEKTGRYIAIDDSGKIYGSVSQKPEVTFSILLQLRYTTDCMFKESVFENYYCIYTRIQPGDDSDKKVQDYSISQTV